LEWRLEAIQIREDWSHDLQRTIEYGPPPEDSNSVAHSYYPCGSRIVKLAGSMMAEIVADRIVNDDRLFALPPMETIFEFSVATEHGMDVAGVSDKPW
jgi:hypothetical protein